MKHIGWGKALVLLIIACIIMAPSFHPVIGGVQTRKTTVTESTTVTGTEFIEKSFIQTEVKTVVRPKIEESVYDTYKVVTTKKTVSSLTYVYSTVTTRSKGGQGQQKTWITVYVITLVPHDVPVTTYVPRRVKTQATKLITLTETVNLTQYMLVISTSAKLYTATLTKIYETQYIEEFEEEEQSQLITAMKNYGLIIAAAIIIVLAIIPKRLFKKRRRLRY